MRYLILLLIIFLSGCDGCKPDTIDCKGAKIMLCDSSGNWSEVEDCSENETLALYSPTKWTCVIEDNKAKCILVDN